MNYTGVSHSLVEFSFSAPYEPNYIDNLIRFCVAIAIIHLHALLEDIVFLIGFWIFFVVIPLDHILQTINFLIN